MNDRPDEVDAFNLAALMIFGCVLIVGLAYGSVVVYEKYLEVQAKYGKLCQP